MFVYIFSTATLGSHNHRIDIPPSSIQLCGVALTVKKSFYAGATTPFEKSPFSDQLSRNGYRSCSGSFIIRILEILEDQKVSWSSE